MAKCYRGCPVYRQFIGARSEWPAFMGGMQPSARNVYYTGPCPEADPNDRTNMDSPLCGGVCRNICSGICGFCAQNGFAPEAPVYALYASQGLLDLSAGDILPLADSVYSVGPVAKTGGTASVGQSGRYLAVVTLTGEAQADISAGLVLLKNGVPVPGGMLAVDAAQGENIALVAQTVFCAKAGDTLQLAAQGAVPISGDPAAVLTLVRVG